jgi:hypothetical protein
VTNEAKALTRTISQIDYGSIVTRNREIFLLNFGHDFRSFEQLLMDLQSSWLRVAHERDRTGKSHVGLLLLSSILIRHSAFGFQQLASYQSFLTWLAFRPGLESLLMIGKWVDDPKNAQIWRERERDAESYRRTYAGRALISRSLPKSDQFQGVLSRLNDQFVHPNPYFAYRESNLSQASSKTFVLETRFFDVRAELHEAHLLAYLHLLDMIITSSVALIEERWGSAKGPAKDAIRPPISTQEGRRAKLLAERDPLAKKIMEELGLWQFS